MSWGYVIMLLVIVGSIASAFANMIVDEKIRHQRAQIDKLIKEYNRVYLAKARLDEIVKTIDADKTESGWLKEYII